MTIPANVPDSQPDTDQDERLARWRLLLGGAMEEQLQNSRHQRMDAVLEELYGKGKDGKKKKQGGKGGQGKKDKGAKGQNRRQQRRKQMQGDDRFGSSADSMPDVDRWLGDIRKYFPDSVAQVMQRDAIEKMGLRKLLSQPDILDVIEPDMNLVSALITLKDVIPGETKASARVLVKKVVDDLMKRLESPMRQAVRGALNRADRNLRPRHREINWVQTVNKNLKHYQKEYESIIPETLIGYGHRRHAVHDVIICIDQSGSMGRSLVYASVFGAVMASIPALSTHMVVFDTAVADLTAHLSDPVDLLFGTKAGGGTDIDSALAYCQQLIVRPQRTTLVLISDLYEGGDNSYMLARAARLKASGVQMIVLLALDDEGVSAYDHQAAQAMAAMDIPAFACTPDLFPELMAGLMNRQNIQVWASHHDIRTVRARDDDTGEGDF